MSVNMESILLRDWEVSGYYPYVPILGMTEPRLGRSITGWIPARVPGSVHDDLYRAGWIPDPYFGMNSLACEWVENKWWVYRTRFDVPADGQRCRLRMNGLDDCCRIYLNGRFLARHEGSFVPFAQDITGLVKPTDNELLVIFEAVPDEESQAGHASHTRTQKSRFSYKWDFSARMVPVGIWDAAWIEHVGSVVLDDVYLSTELSGNGGRVCLRADCVAGDTPAFQEVALTMRVSLRGNEVARVEKSLRCHTGRNRTTLEASLAMVERWYPNGLGDQPLYQVDVTVSDRAGVSHAWRGRAGFRELCWVRNEGAPNGALPYCLWINGDRVYLKGVNLTPFDMLPGCVTDDKYRRWLCRIKAANINLVRVNGVGLIEKEVFYDLCDEMGILVWQEFIQTSSSMDRTPPTAPDYLERLGRTAAAAMRQKRHHACLACYCGGNELTDAPGVPATRDNPNIRFLQQLVDLHDPGRMFFPASASGPNEFLILGRPEGNHDVHGPWNYDPDTHYRLYNESNSLLHGELGAEGMAHPESLARFLPPEDLVVTDMQDNLTWRHHGDWWDPRRLVERAFGRVESLSGYAFCSQLIQAEAVRYALEANRRRKYANSGSMLWAFNEPFPNVSNTSLVDAYGVPKIACYALRDAYAPLHLSLKYDSPRPDPAAGLRTQVYLHNSLGSRRIAWRAELIMPDGRSDTIREGCADAPANSAVSLGALEVGGKDLPAGVFMLRLTVTDPASGVADVNEYWFSTAEQPAFQAVTGQPHSDLNWEETGMETGTGALEGCVTRSYRVRNQGRRLAAFVRPVLPGENAQLFCDMAYKSLLPGEERVCRVTAWSADAPWDRLTFAALFD